MKVLHICYSDLDGGAARAAWRLHQAQLKAGIDSYMVVVNKLSSDKRVLVVNKTTKLRIKINSAISGILLARLTKKNPVKHSLNLLPTGVAKFINNLNADIINLHWIGSDMLSVGEVAALKAPIVWTLHDMWAFSGCEHYDTYPELKRYRDNYKKDTQNGLLDINAFMYRYKKWKWKNKNISFVSPSQWLASCLQSSSLGQSKKSVVIQNCIDHDIYAPVAKHTARELLGLPIERKLVLFGAMSSTSDARKGFLLLEGALKLLGEEGHHPYALVVFGAEKKPVEQHYGLDTYHLGVLKDDLTLRLLYSAADVYVAPSLQDNLPNTLVESLAVGTPCVAFNIGGMPDLIMHADLGVLVDTIEIKSLAEGIHTALNNYSDNEHIRSLSVAMRSEEVIVENYKRIYGNV
ncbi:glycosyltransferase [Enterobacter sp.]|uniref:glycosyltransferase n=1 Tax=Enterobacter sp. TaxID=42895 RepID=UPI00296F5D39|nr:glycosyltransferase [Enterobacter sp.]